MSFLIDAFNCFRRLEDAVDERCRFCGYENPVGAPDLGDKEDKEDGDKEDGDNGDDSDREVVFSAEWGRPQPIPPNPTEQTLELQSSLPVEARSALASAPENVTLCDA